MSRSYRYERPEVRKAKALRRELVRPLRKLLDDTHVQIMFTEYDLEKVYLRGGGCRTLEVRLTEPLDADAIFDWMDADLDAQESFLDDRRARVDRARRRYEEVQA